MKTQMFALAAAIVVAVGWTRPACADPSLSLSGGATNANTQASFSFVVKNPGMTLLDMNNPIVSVSINGTNISGFLFNRGKDNLSGSLNLSANIPAGDQMVDLIVLMDNGVKVEAKATLTFAKSGNCDTTDDPLPDD